jgi:hypothetical protein
VLGKIVTVPEQFRLTPVIVKVYAALPTEELVYPLLTAIACTV